MTAPTPRARLAAWAAAGARPETLEELVLPVQKLAIAPVPDLFLSDFASAAAAVADAVASAASADGGEKKYDESFPVLRQGKRKPKKDAKRKLTPRKVAAIDVSGAVALAGATAVPSDASVGRDKVAHDLRPDPFLRATGAPLSPSAAEQTPPAPSKTDVEGGVKPSWQDKLEKGLRDPIIGRAASLHAECIRECINHVTASTHTTASVLSSVVSVLCVGTVMSTDASACSLRFSSANAGVFRILSSYTTLLDLVAHAVLVLGKLDSFIATLPTPVMDAFLESAVLQMFGEHAPKFAIAAEKRGLSESFPVATGAMVSTAIGAIPNSTNPSIQRLGRAPEPVPPRLSSNLELVWDQVVALQRKYRGDISSVAPGTLDRAEAVRAVGALHPANMDSFAARLIALLVQSSLQTRDAPPKIRHLDARLRTSRGGTGPGSGDGLAATAERVTQKTATDVMNERMGASRIHGPQRHRGSGTNASNPSAKSHQGQAGVAAGHGKDKPVRGKHGPGVVLHRLPDVVRDMFRDDVIELFFLDFLSGVDSAKLNAAITPRLSVALHHALVSAASSASSSSFTDAVTRARRFAKFLSVVLHGGNWAHSTRSLSGVGDGAHGVHTLAEDAARWRAAVCCPLWTATVDLQMLLKEATASGQELRLIASVVVADVLLRLAVVDPIAEATTWFQNAVRAVRQLVVVPEDAAAESSSEVVPLPGVLVRLLVEELLCSLKTQAGLVEDEERSLHTLGQKVADKWSNVGDTRFIRECVPAFDELRRQLLNTPGGISVMARGPPRRIRPVATPRLAGESGIGTVTEVAGEGNDAAGQASWPGRVSLLSTAKGHVGEMQSSPKSLVAAKIVEGVHYEHREDRHGTDVADTMAALRQEFYMRMDGRLRELIGIVVASKPNNAEHARRSYSLIAKTLYPDCSTTVVAVAAGVCGHEVEWSAQTEGGVSLTGENVGCKAKQQCSGVIKRLFKQDDGFRSSDTSQGVGDLARALATGGVLLVDDRPQ